MRLLPDLDHAHKPGTRRCKCTPHWGWMVVVASYIACFLSLGINFSSGLYYVQWMEHFGASSGMTSWIGSLQIGLLCLPGPVATYLGERFGDRNIVIISGFVSSAGLVASAYLDNLYAMMVTYGVVTGFGFCLLFANIATAPMYFFKTESAGLAVGIALSGGGCGAFIMPALIEHLIEAYGWKGSLLILGGLTLNICVCGALLRKPPMKTIPQGQKKKNLNFKVFKNVNLVLFLLHQILFATGYSVVYIHITAVIETITDVSGTKSSLALTVIGIMNFLGRIFHGAIGGLKTVHVMSQYLASYAITGIALIIFPNLQFYPALLVIAGIFGFFTAPYASLTQLIMVQYAGFENLKFVYGIFLFNAGIGLVAGAPIAGLLYDVTKDYGISIYFGGASFIMCVLLMLKPWVQSCRPIQHLSEYEHGQDDIEKDGAVSQLINQTNGSVT